MAVDTSRLDWRPVSSSNVAAGAWDETFERLYVRFRSGAVYEYSGVSRATWLAFLNAPSKGQFVFRVLRGNGTDGAFGYRKL